MNIDVYLAPGHIDVSTLTTGTTYLLRAFTHTSDMGAGNLWYCNTIPPHHQTRRVAMSGKVQGQGYYISSLDFDVFTFGMRDHFKDTYFSGSETTFSANVTVGLYTASNEVFYLQGVMVMPDWGQLARGGQQIAIGYQNVSWRLLNGVQIS